MNGLVSNRMVIYQNGGSYKPSMDADNYFHSLDSSVYVLKAAQFKGSSEGNPFHF